MIHRKLTGSLKAAILIHAVGPAAAGVVLNNLSDDQKRLVSQLQSQMGKIPAELMEQVAREFLDNTRRLNAPAEVEAPETEEVNENSHLATVQALEAGQLLQLIKDEHPQTIALILVHLNSRVASDVLAQMPEETKSDVALRIANLDKVVSGMVEEIDKIFEELLKNQDALATQEAGGVERLAEILNQIDGTSAEQIIDEIEENDPDLADEIKSMMFVFDDIVMVDDPGLQKVLRNVETSELALALKASSEDVKQKIFRNMSERAGEILKEEMDVSGAVRMKDVTDAQQKITRLIQEMERKGELVISGRGGEEFIG
ncbi:MAG: flagellar motor switch protein FliG [Desulfobacteraceae bacterium]|nr:flagellar motor switch protein FliG [Desulfobacteraceae bacterium]